MIEFSFLAVFAMISYIPIVVESQPPELESIWLDHYSQCNCVLSVIRVLSD